MNDFPKLDIRTHCRDCVMAVYDGDTQEGCELGRIEKFEERGAEVRGIDDGERRFLTIDRFCNACHNEASPHLRGVAPADRPAFLRKLVTARVAMIIHVGESTTEADLLTTLGTVKTQSIPPVQIVIALAPETSLSVPTAIRHARDSGVDFKVVECRASPEEEQGVYKSEYLRNVDLAVAQVKATYYSTCPAGGGWTGDFVAKLDRAINDEMVPLVAVTTIDDRCYTTIKKLHDHPFVAGNRGDTLLEKLPHLADHYGFRMMAWEELACV